LIIYNYLEGYLKILFYSLPNRNAVLSSNVHITEVFAHLTSFGHKIYYANGEHFQIINEAKFNNGESTPKTVSRWGSLKNLMRKTPLRGEAHILLNFFQEIILFLLASRTIYKYKPDVIYRRRGFLNIFGSEHILRTAFGIPVVSEVNGIAIDEARICSSGDNFSLKLIDFLERKNIRKADKYIAVTSKLKTTLYKDYGIAKGKITIIENGANTDLFKPIDKTKTKKQLGLVESISYICFVGVISPWQGVEYLIKAMPGVLKTVPNTKLLIVGDGVMKSELLHLTNKLNIGKNVIFTGRVPYTKVPLYINSSDICVAPFVKQRNEKIGLSPLKLCEYLACRVPVIASDISGVSDTIRTSQGGTCVAPEDAEQLASAIIKLLLDENLRNKMGENGYNYVKENRSWESDAKKVETVFKEAVDMHKQN
jgi:glycosyltransferase involved in cell wall biosynthesis